MKSDAIDVEFIERQAQAIALAGRQAVREAIAQHKRDGDPIVVWEDGQVRWISAAEIKLPDGA